MAKSFYTTGTGDEQTLTPIINEKVPIYDTIADAESDLSNLEVGQIVKTKDAGLVANLNPIDEVKQGVFLPPTSNAVAESLSYSTTEQKTGGKWIDGKDIYRKVLTGTSIPSDNYIGEIPDFDTVIKVDGWIKDASLGNWLPVGYGVVSNNTSNPQMRVDSNTKVYFAVANYSVLKYVVTLEYTKNE